MKCATLYLISKLFVSAAKAFGGVGILRSDRGLDSYDIYFNEIAHFIKITNYSHQVRRISVRCCCCCCAKR